MATPSLAMIPSGYKEGKVYSVLPNNGDGDFTFSRGSNATRVNKDGLIETVTGDTPRLDYTDISCPSLLLEPQSTNLIEYSEDFTTGWSNLINGSGINPVVTSNQGTSPDGSLNADKVVFDLNGGTEQSDYSLLDYSLSGFSNPHTLDTSIYLKSSDANDYQVVIYNRGTSPQVITVTNQWQRFSVNGTRSNTTNNFRLGLFGHNSSNTASLLLFGAQVEEQSFATSYIPTNGSTATRNADDCKLDNFGSMPSNYPITVYGEVLPNELSSDSHAFSLLQNVDTSGSYYLSLELTSTTDLKIKRRDADTNDADTISHTLAVGTPFKFAVCFQNETDYKYSFDGLSAVSVTTSDTVTWDYNDVLLGTLRLVSDTGSRNPIKEFRLYDTELTDAELKKLTT